VTGDISATTLALAKALLERPSVTPDDGGCLELVANRLVAAGFTCERLDRGVVRNLWACRGNHPPLVCLAGHVDVVPPGPIEQWTSDPFTPTERDGFLYARGAADMKGPLAAAITAVERLVSREEPTGGSLAWLLTSDEEGAAIDGTAAVVEVLRQRGVSIDHCILVEPTSEQRLGDTLKNGRRGSLNATLTVHGVQGHVAYPRPGANPIHAAVPALSELVAIEWDAGDDDFPPTSLQVSNVHAGTGANNVVPGSMTVLFNVRFSPASPPEAIQRRVQEILDRHKVDCRIEWALSGMPFRTARGRLTEVMTAAVREVTGVTPALSTSGGTSDGRFIAAVAREVIELGPVNASIHRIDECVRLADLAALSQIYERALLALLRPGGDRQRHAGDDPVR
jgi:succinyl-diaminopimelate desuccinylase